MTHVSVDTLEAKFPGEGRSRYNAIAMLAGGDLAGPHVHEGGLDLTGVLDTSNKAFDDDTRGRIKALTQNKTANPAAAEEKKEGTN